MAQREIITSTMVQGGPLNPKPETDAYTPLDWLHCNEGEPPKMVVVW